MGHLLLLLISSTLACGLIVIMNWGLLLERNDFDSELVDQQWQDLKVCVKRNYSLILMEIMLVLQLAKACSEYGFSTLKCIKSDWRSRLGIETLDHLMISIDGPHLEMYKAARAVLPWWDEGDQQ